MIKLTKSTPPHLMRPLPTYEQVSESTFELDWADLVTLDLSKFDQPGGKQHLAQQLKNAVNEIGFFYITNVMLTYNLESMSKSANGQEVRTHSG